MTKNTRYEAPYHWWGPRPAPPAPMMLQDLVHDGTIDIDRAARLCAALAQHQPLTIIGGPSGLGKSTLLGALLPFLPQGNHRVYLRGCYETFAFQDDRRLRPASTSLLINEISPHLPIYLWGPAVQRVLAAGEAGYQILATAHGRNVAEFAATLTGSPLRVPARMLAAIGLVALLEPAPGRSGRRVTELWQLSAAREGVAVDLLGPSDFPAGVTADQVANTRSAILSMLAHVPARTDARPIGVPEADNPERGVADLERTSAGE